jgi:hypothetical protein
MKVMAVRRISDAGYDRIAFEASEEVARKGAGEPIVERLADGYSARAALTGLAARQTCRPMQRQPTFGGALDSGPRGLGSPSAEDAAAGCGEVM